ncbi:MAG: homoserine kinase [Xanthomonadales bacterium PRO7]|nr:homoserine kinase [Xanthomonadales bacterium PRO7]
MKQTTAFAPASIGNLGVGFDILGQTFEGAGDRATVRCIDEPVVRIVAIRGLDNLPMDAASNTAGAALIALCNALDLPFGLEIELDKGIPFGSGMGGSAASCVAALVAANALLENPLHVHALYPFALHGESVASGGRHGDNVGPMLVGGVALTTAERIIPIAVPDAWHSVLVHPHAVLEARRAREALKGAYAIGNFVEQSANFALFLEGCRSGDVELVRAGLRDVLVEPRRAPLIGGFAQVKQAALDHAAMGASISGAGPSVFAWFETRAAAEIAAPAMRAAFAAAGFSSESFVSPVNGPAARVIP